MLRELRIRDLAVIEDLAVDFGPGLNVLSGETGAGKSIILGALGLVLGGRAAPELVRTGRESAEVVARFDWDEDLGAALEEMDLGGESGGEAAEGLLLRRVVSEGGRSRAYVGGTAVPATALKRLGALLVDYASQHEHQVLLDEATHTEILDRFAGLQDRRAAVAGAVAALRAQLGERERLASLEREQRAREEYLRFQLDELDRAAPEAGEMERLDVQRNVLRNAEQLAGRARAAEEALYSGAGAAVERLSDAVGRMRELNHVDPSLGATLEGLEAALISVEEAGRELSAYARRTRCDPARLEEIEDRVGLLRQLARKHRVDVEALAVLREKMRGEIEELGSLEARLAALDRQVRDARVLAREAAAGLTAGRERAGSKLAAAVEAELRTLAMPAARFRVVLEPVAAGADAVGAGEGGGDDGAGVAARAGPWLSASGAERAAFHLSANPGEDPRPLSRVASGGELSRVLLSVRRVLAGSSRVQACVFDEIDAGLGGQTASVVAGKLAEVARESQVLCITHLAVIAARADAHYVVEKAVQGGRTRARVRKLDAGERVGELARMVGATGMGGAAEALAREMLEARG
jgi:DNA repair protein RecN (Recombination protein N)